jgi:hypothetical protein
MSSPKFTVGQSVYFTQDRLNQILKNQEELLLKYSSEDLGEMPTGKLYLDTPPYQNNKGEWMYPYVYGCWGNHEGVAAESDLTIFLR